MPARYYICPVVNVEIAPGSGEFARVPKVMTFPTARTGAAVADSATWALVAVEASAAQHAVIEADPQCVDVFERLSDLAGETNRAGLVAWLKSRTIGSVSAAVRTRIRNRLTAAGISITGLTNASTFYEVVRRVLAFHEPAAMLENLG